MMRPHKTVIPIVFCLLILFSIFPRICRAHVYRLADGSTVTFSEMIDDLMRVQAVFIGESHNNPAHHQAQLQVIRALHEEGSKLVLGLEMFRRDSQYYLDQWVAGNLTLHEFIDVFNDNWSDWNQYQEVFHYARLQKIPMIGLNVSRSIVRQVAHQGFASLSEEQLSKLPVVSCVVDPAYERFIRRAMGDHSETDVPFHFFCEAQLLWDQVMAENILRFLTEHPDYTVLVLAGSGHSWKHGIPTQIRNRRADFTYRTLLPEVSGHTSENPLTSADADYLLVGVDQAPLH